MFDLTSFLNKSAYYKEKSFEIADLFEKSDLYYFKDKADLIRHCADRLILNNINDNTDKFISRYCRLRFCPQCQFRKSIKNYGQIIQVAENLDCSWLHMVLTVRNCFDNELDETIDKLFVNSTKLFKIYKKNFKGIVRACEVTYNSKEKTYHPHLHCLIAVNKSYFTSRYYVKQATLLNSWRGLINDGNNGGLYISRVTDKSCSVAEIAKYCLKPLDCEIPEQEKLNVYQVIYTALKGKRLLQTFGIVSKELKKIKDSYKPLVDKEDIVCSTHYYYNGARYEPTSIDNKITERVYNLKNGNSPQELVSV